MNCRDHDHGDGGGLQDDQVPRLVTDSLQPCNQSITIWNENQMFGKWLEVSGQGERHNRHRAQ